MMSYSHNLSHISYMKLRGKYEFLADADKINIPVLMYVRIKINSHLFWADRRLRFTFAYLKMRFSLSLSVNEMCRKLSPRSIEYS